MDEILIGLLLGDGHLQCRKTNSRFFYGQSSLREHHLNYFYHIYELFKPYISEDYKIKPRSFINKMNNKTYSSVYFATLTLPCLNYYRDLFYNSQNKKIVPLNSNKLLTPRGLAYWIMDDGSIQNQGLHLNTYAFSREEVEILKTTIENLFAPLPLEEDCGSRQGEQIKCSIHSHQKGYRIYIWNQSMGIIRNHISQYMHNDMLYKINP